ncbi:hypothetical protein OF83DRAFT_222318 [Amylostereum chailletii]|nr:hypothetical protein OF83DRAFT_222318 [Amylostereum chailletii]
MHSTTSDKGIRGPPINTTPKSPYRSFDGHLAPCFVTLMAVDSNVWMKCPSCKVKVKHLEKHTRKCLRTRPYFDSPADTAGNDLDVAPSGVEKPNIITFNTKLAKCSREIADVQSTPCAVRERTRLVTISHEANKGKRVALYAELDILRGTVSDRGRPLNMVDRRNMKQKKAELEDLKQERDILNVSRQELFNEQKALLAQIKSLHNQKLKSAQRSFEAKPRPSPKPSTPKRRDTSLLNDLCICFICAAEVKDLTKHHEKCHTFLGQCPTCFCLLPRSKLYNVGVSHQAWFTSLTAQPRDTAPSKLPQACCHFECATSIFSRVQTVCAWVSECEGMAGALE